ncbi:MAG: Na(+)/H(+) antiporter subunit B [Desulfurococcaceae archaeon]|jgi:multicomponent Na+:H+ antiporter subunit B|nr:Na(+)/H(+) antiporter subunit B [Desulfurococcaceae archaeon]
MSKRILVLLIITILSLLTSLLITLLLGVKAPTSIRDLGKYYVANTIQDTASPEAVTAIVWDYRGLDTIYETTVLYMAIVGGLAISTISRKVQLKTRIGLTGITRTATRITVLLIATIAFAIALHGHLTPGGGFPGGSAMAITAMLIVPVYTLQSLLERGVTSTRLVAARGLALTAIGLVAILPVLRGLEAVTNQKFYPSHIAGMLISGSLWFYNFFEFLAVASGFAAVALYLSIPEELYREELRGGG